MGKGWFVGREVPIPSKISIRHDRLRLARIAAQDRPNRAVYWYRATQRLGALVINLATNIHWKTSNFCSPMTLEHLYIVRMGKLKIRKQKIKSPSNGCTLNGNRVNVSGELSSFNLLTVRAICLPVCDRNGSPGCREWYATNWWYV